MIKSHKYNFIYLHIPKTGGTTVIKNLLDPAQTQQIGPEMPHGSISEVSDDHFLSNPYIFSTVRDPVEWYLSVFLYPLSLWSRAIFGHGFETWINNACDFKPEATDFSVAKWKKGPEYRSYPAALDGQFSAKALASDKKLRMDNAGWLSHLYIYSCCRNYRNVIEQNDIDNVCKNYKKIFEVQQFIATPSLDHLKSVIKHPPLKSAPLEKFKHFNYNIHRDRSENLQTLSPHNHDKILAKIREKDRLVYTIFNDAINEQGTLPDAPSAPPEDLPISAEQLERFLNS